MTPSTPGTGRASGGTPVEQTELRLMPAAARGAAVALVLIAAA
jgi:hypothetical protein